MQELSEFLSAANAINDRIKILSTFLDIDNAKHEIGKMEESMSAPNFWDNQFLAKETGSKLHALKRKLASVENLKKAADEINILLEFASLE
ncbi:MAG: hypothetical protein LBC30_02375, partial [Puniceicoccales bacterium]|nr:hypothetical protein [Puniceicoccales bacterium]